MLEIKSLKDVRGNNVVIYSIETLLERNAFPKLSIMAGVMGVGKTSVARVVANEIDKSGMPVKVYNFGMNVDMQKLNEEVFAMKPSQPKAFIFEEIHGLPKSEQNALLQMFDSQGPTTYVICTTTDLHKVLRTIRSRAQVWEFKLLSEKQCAKLLDDYLQDKGVTLSAESKKALLRACRGVPRDLLKNADFALEGNFTPAQLDALLGNVSDELVFTLFCALKSETATFVTNLEELIDDVSSTKLAALTDFWLRYLMERAGGSQQTLKTSMVTTLNSIYTPQELSGISKVLLRARPDTLLLELLNLNMSLTKSTQSELVGVQKDVARRAESEHKTESQSTQQVHTSAQLSSDSVKGFQL